MPILFIQGENEKKNHIHYEVNPDLPSLGEGGMGQVLRGVRVNEQNGLRQDVAIKFLYEDLPADAIERARREAAIQIHHENLVEMLGFIEIIEDDGVKHYNVVSELLQGVMLFDLLNGKTTDKFGNEVDFARELYTQYQNDKFGFAVFMVKNILSGIMALHDKGYIHRDLDPSNIMITHDRKVKIIDFGIAKQLNSLNTEDRQLTSTGQFVGKAAYAAPELVLGDVHHQDQTTDLYAVGIMLYQFIVGRLPFEGTIAELIKQQLNEKIPLKLVPNKTIRHIIGKATAKKQADRYKTAAEMRVDLDDAVPSPPAKKNFLIVAVAVGMLVIGGLIALLVSNRKPVASVVDTPDTSIIVEQEKETKTIPEDHHSSEELQAKKDSSEVVAITARINQFIKTSAENRPNYFSRSTGNLAARWWKARYNAGYETNESDMPMYYWFKSCGIVNVTDLTKDHAEVDVIVNVNSPWDKGRRSYTFMMVKEKDKWKIHNIVGEGYDLREKYGY